MIKKSLSKQSYMYQRELNSIFFCILHVQVIQGKTDSIADHQM